MTRPIFGFTPSPFTLQAVAAHLTQPPPAPGPNLIVTPNLDHIVQLRRNPAFRAAYHRATIILCDGFPVHYYARLHGHMCHRVPGSDLIAHLMHHITPPTRLTFVLDGPQTAQAVQSWAETRAIPATTTIPPYGFIHRPEACTTLARTITESRPTLLIMAVGAPQSEIFIDRYHSLLPDCWTLCVGQGVRMALGLTSRAPPIIRTLHTEWLWRLLQDPSRLTSRYTLGAVRFLAAIVADMQRK